MLKYNITRKEYLLCLKCKNKNRTAVKKGHNQRDLIRVKRWNRPFSLIERNAIPKMNSSSNVFQGNLAVPFCVFAPPTR